ncbi:MAG TPA: 3'-5' exonuclease [Candidatus Agrococcus pullicola]|uniref:3'-5' exonuclease n=1 Tax=Candidatus Agrococcus pullicola TaxID=2838429 RepID=A0A9D1YS12_9MICO|nr:3'-5' exonuclease [Candidatus Agrococcus pullicola]
MSETEAAAPEAPWAARLAVFDLETTGVQPDRDRIVTAFVGEIDLSGDLVQGRHWLINPGIPIPEAASKVHGVTDEIAQADGVEAATGVAEIAGLIGRLFEGGVPIAAFNAAYDFTLLDRECRRYAIPAPKPTLVIDPLILDKQVDRYRRGRRTLEATSSQYGVSLEGWHEAAADAATAGRLAQAIGRAYEEVRVPAHDLHAKQEEWARQQAESFAEYMRRSKNPDFVAERGWPVRE